MTFPVSAQWVVTIFFGKHLTICKSFDDFIKQFDILRCLSRITKNEKNGVIEFISGVYGGIKISSIFSGIFNEPDLCHAAPSHANIILSLGNVLDNSSKNTFILSVLQYGITTKQLSPVSGSTAPYTYLYSLI